jgi:hypothetical protein
MFQRFFIKEAAKGMSNVAITAKEIKTIKLATEELGRAGKSLKTTEEFKNVYQKSGIVDSLKNLFTQEREGITLFKAGVPERASQIGGENLLSGGEMVGRGKLLQKLQDNVGTFNAAEQTKLQKNWV